MRSIVLLWTDQSDVSWLWLSQGLWFLSLPIVLNQRRNFDGFKRPSTKLITTSLKFPELKTKKRGGRIPPEQNGNQRIFSFGAENIGPENSKMQKFILQLCPDFTTLSNYFKGGEQSCLELTILFIRKMRKASLPSEWPSRHFPTHFYGHG